MVVRETRDASGLSKQEMDDGVEVLEEKVGRIQPEAVCLVGKGVWEAVERVWMRRGGRGIGKEGKRKGKEKFEYGWREKRIAPKKERNDEWEGAKLFVATTTSGLAAGMRPHEKEAVWKILGDWVLDKRKEDKETTLNIDQETVSVNTCK